MRITLNQFRCYETKVFEVEDGQITLLSGSSGIGKSTLFEAIYFALYGTLRNVNPHGTDASKVKTSVVVESPTFTVIRRKHPNTLRYTSKGLTFDNLEAQKQIENDFGPENVWLTTSYLIQNERSPLISYSTAERMAIVKYLAFHQEDPYIYIERISKQLEILRQQKNTEEIKYNQDHQWITRMMEVDKVTLDYCLPDEMMKDLLSQQQSLFIKFQELSKKKTLKIQVEQQRTTLTRIIDESNKELSTLIPRELLETESLLKENEEIKKQHYQQQERVKQQEKNRLILRKRAELLDQLRNGQKVLDEKLPGWASMTLEDPNLTRRQEAEFNHYHSLAESIGVVYTNEKIQLMIKSLEILQEKQKKYQRLQQLRQQREREKVSIPRPTEDEILLLKKKYEDGSRSLDLLSCPKCGQGLRFVSGKLLPSETSPVSREEVSKWKAEYEALLSLKATYDRLAKLDQEILSLGEISLTEIELKPVDSILQTLKSLKVVKPPPIPSSVIQLVKDWQSQRVLLESYPLVEEIEVKVDPSLITKSEDLDRKLYQVRSENEKIQAHNAKIKALTSQLETRKQELSQLKDVVLEEDPDLIRERITQIETRLAMGKKSNELMILADKHTEHYKELLSLVEDITALESLLQRANSAECLQLESTVQGINALLNDIVSSVFPTSPMTTIMSLTKLTGSERLKQQVNFTMTYKDTTLTNLRQLSGGEGDRLSFAIFLTLSCVSGSPFLLLDEPFGALDSELRDYCISTLKTFAKGKTIICVGHEEVGGRYDRTLTL